MTATPCMWEDEVSVCRIVELWIEKTPLPSQRDSERVRRSMFLAFMVSKTARHFVHSRNLKHECSSNQFLCLTWHGQIHVSQKNGLETF